MRGEDTHRVGRGVRSALAVVIHRVGRGEERGIAG